MNERSFCWKESAASVREWGSGMISTVTLMSERAEKRLLGGIYRTSAMSSSMDPAALGKPEWDVEGELIGCAQPASNAVKAIKISI